MGSQVAHAENLTRRQAQEAAANYLTYCTDRDAVSADDLTLVLTVDNSTLRTPAVYYFNVKNGGWIIMASTTVINPVVAYSHQGTLNPDRFPSNMRWWLDGYTEMVKEIQELDAQNKYPDCTEWVELMNGKAGYSAKGDGERILMTENWGQGDELDPTYNLYCPPIPDVNTSRGIDSTSIVGCVATAMSMICHYFRYPVQPQGNVNYFWRRRNLQLSLNCDTMAPFNYSLMPAGRITPSTTQAQINEVARLCRAAGYIVKMNYGASEGSGAMSADVRYAMQNNFKYKLGTDRYRSSNSDTSFVYRIRRELKKNHILYMSGASSSNGGRDAAGHAWICAGYNVYDSSMYFMNWGWDGVGNAFFNLGVNNMPISGMGYNFNVRQHTILGMVPPDDSNRFYVGIVESDNSLLGSAYPNPALANVTVPYSIDHNADLNVYNIDGKLVKTQRVQAGRGETTIDLAGMPAGVYIYRLGTKAGKFIVRGK